MSVTVLTRSETKPPGVLGLVTSACQCTLAARPLRASGRRYRRPSLAGETSSAPDSLAVYVAFDSSALSEFCHADDLVAFRTAALIS